MVVPSGASDSFAFEHVTRLESAGLAVGDIRQLAQSGGDADVLPAEELGLSAGTDCWTQGFRQLHQGFAWAGMCKPYHGLAGADHLAWLGQCLHDDTVGIGEQLGVAGGVTGNLGLGLGCTELRASRIRRCLVLVVGRCRYRASAAQGAVTSFVIAGLLSPCPRCGHRLALGMGGELQVDRIEAQKHLATLDCLAGIDQTLQHLAGHAETQVALHPGRDDAGEGARCSGCRLDGGDANQWRVSAGIGGVWSLQASSTNGITPTRGAEGGCAGA